MKKRILSLLLAVSLFTCTITPVAFAFVDFDGEEDYVAVADYTAPDGLTITTKGDAYAWYYDPDSEELISGNESVTGTESFSQLAIKTSSAGALSFNVTVSTGDANGLDWFAYNKYGYEFRTSDQVSNSDTLHFTGEVTESVNVPMSAGQVLNITYYRMDFDFVGAGLSRGDDCAKISNITFSSSDAQLELTAVSSDTSLGAVSTDPADLTDVKAGDTITLTADTEENFAGWFETFGGAMRLISEEMTCEYMVRGDATLTARYVQPGENPVAQLLNAKYDNLEEALDDAATYGPKLVKLIDSVSVESDLTIPKDVTLLIPYSEPDDGAEPEIMSTGATDEEEKGTKGNPYVILVVVEDVDLTINGTLLVNGKVGCWDLDGNGSINQMGTIVGDYGVLELDGNANIGNTGVLKARGMVTGSGEINTVRGAEVWQVFEMTDWPGGQEALNMVSDQHEFPINQYYIQRIQVKTTIAQGAKMSAYAYAFASLGGTKVAALVPMDGLIGPDDGAFIQTESGSVVFDYDPDGSKTLISVNGEVNLKSFAIGLSGIGDISTDGVVCPVASAFDITVESGSTINITKDFKLLPGSEITVEEGASLVVQSGASVQVYGAADYNDQRVTPSSSDLVTTISETTGASVVNNGTIIVENGGTVVTSAAEPDLITGTGEIDVQPGGTYIPGALGGIIIHFNANGGTGTMDDQVFRVGQSGQLPMNTFTRLGYNFLGWSSSPDSVVNPFASLDPSMAGQVIPDGMALPSIPDMGISEATFYVVWESNGNEVYTVSFLDEDGETVLADPQEVEENGVVIEPEEPSKDGFTFAGWFDGVSETAFDFETPITGDLTLTAHWTEVQTATLTQENFTNSTGNTAAIEITDAANGVFMVTCAKACVVAVDNGDGTYTRLTATLDSGNAYRFTCPEGFDSSIALVVGVKGDVNGDGRINALDAAQVKSASINKLTFAGANLLRADVNKDGRINALDAAQVKSSSINKLTFSWN